MEASISASRGLDLGRHYGDLRRIYFKFFSRRAAALDLEDEDVLQGVAMKVVRANMGRSPFDPNRSSLGHYLYICIDSYLRNQAEKARGPNGFQNAQVGMFNPVTGRYDDAAVFAVHLPASEELEDEGSSCQVAPDACGVAA